MQGLLLEFFSFFLFQVVFLILVTSKIEAARYGEHCNVFDSCSDPAQICVGTVCICDAGYIHVIGGCVSSKYLKHFVNICNLPVTDN